MATQEDQERALDFFHQFGNTLWAINQNPDPAPVFPIKYAFSIRAGQDHVALAALRSLRETVETVPGYKAGTTPINAEAKRWEIATGIHAQRKDIPIPPQEQERAFDFFDRFGRSHGAIEMYRDGEPLLRTTEEDIADILDDDYPSFDSLAPHGLFPMKYVFAVKAGEEHLALATLKDLRASVERMLPDYAAGTAPINPEAQRWNIATGIYAQRRKGGIGLKEDQIEVTIDGPKKEQIEVTIDGPQ